MTKAEIEKIRQECAEGKHACSAEYLIAQRKKDEKRREKREQKRIDKSNEELQSALARVKELEQHNHELEKLVEELKALKMDEYDKIVVQDCEAFMRTCNGHETSFHSEKEQIIDEALEEYTLMHKFDNL